MELNDIIMLGACSLLSGVHPQRNAYSPANIKLAVEIAKDVWAETLKPERDDRE